MGNAIRAQELSLEEDLLKNAYRYSFEMAAKVLSYGSRENYGKEISIEKSPFFTVSINSFYLRGTEIEKITEKDGKKNVFIERLSLAGINAPLPSPYAEIVYNRNLEKDFAFGQFLNAFNSRVLGISYRISKRRYLCLQADSNCEYTLLKTISNFLGENNHAKSKKMSRLAYLFWNKEKSAAGLESIIQYLFGFNTKVQQLSRERVKNDEIKRLGQAKLGRDFDLGDHFITHGLGITVYLSSEDYQKVFELLSEQSKAQEVFTAIRRYIGDFLRFTVFVSPEKVPPLIMKKTLLGRTSWISGRKPDAARI